MKKIIYIAATFSLLLLLGACTDSFMEKDTQGSVDRSVLLTQEGVNLLTVNAYSHLTSEGYGATPLNWSFGSVYGGDANKGSEANDQAVVNEIEMYGPSVANGYLTEKWKWTFNASKKANDALVAIAETEALGKISADFANKRRGELYFLRAYFYFELVKVFGPFVPYVDETQEGNNPKVHNDVDIYPKIVADIDRAIANLPLTQAEAGRPNKWAAKAMKCKIMAQQGKLVEVKDLLKECIDNGTIWNGTKYGLFDKFNDNFTIATENGKESVWAIQFSVAHPFSANDGMGLNYPHGSFNCCGFFQPSFELVESFKTDADGLPMLDGAYRTKTTQTQATKIKDPKPDNTKNDSIYKYITDLTIQVDPRLDHTVGRFDVDYKGHGFPKSDWVRDALNGGFYLPKKHVYSKAELDAGLTVKIDGWKGGSALNYEVIRVSDLYLLYAEACVLTADFGGAREYVNLVRNRAAKSEGWVRNDKGLPAANYKVATYPAGHPAFANKDVALKAVLFERKLELGMEGHRFFDLARQEDKRIMVNDIADYVKYEKGYLAKFVNAVPLKPERYMFPIPQNQIDNMGTDDSGKPWLVQNAAWK